MVSDSFVRYGNDGLVVWKIVVAVNVVVVYGGSQCDVCALVAGNGNICGVCDYGGGGSGSSGVVTAGIEVVWL